MITIADIKKQEVQVCSLLEMKTEQLFWLKLENGCQYLSIWAGEEQTRVLQLQQLPEFWSWWQQIWYTMDKAFICRFINYHEMFSLKEWIGEYKGYHAPDSIAYRPNQAVVESYRTMVKNKARQVAGLNTEKQD